MQGRLLNIVQTSENPLEALHERNIGPEAMLLLLADEPKIEAIGPREAILTWASQFKECAQAVVARVCELLRSEESADTAVGWTALASIGKPLEYSGESSLTEVAEAVFAAGESKGDVASILNAAASIPEDLVRLRDEVRWRAALRYIGRSMGEDMLELIMAGHASEVADRMMEQVRSGRTVLSPRAAFVIAHGNHDHVVLEAPDPNVRVNALRVRLETIIFTKELVEAALAALFLADAGAEGTAELSSRLRRDPAEVVPHLAAIICGSDSGDMRLYAIEVLDGILKAKREETLTALAPSVEKLFDRSFDLRLALLEELLLSLDNVPLYVAGAIIRGHRLDQCVTLLVKCLPGRSGEIFSLLWNADYRVAAAALLAVAGGPNLLRGELLLAPALRRLIGEDATAPAVKIAAAAVMLRYGIDRVKASAVLSAQSEANEAFAAMALDAVVK